MPYKLNLGSGAVAIDGYLNLDIKTGDSIFPLHDVDGAVDEVRASHVLEHFPHGEVETVVKEWARVLKPGGKLKIAVPDFDWIVRAYTNGHRDDSRLEGFLFGGQVDADDYHKSFFNEDKLKALLEGAGLVDVKKWESDAADCSSYDLSLNLEGRKPDAKAWDNIKPACEFLKRAKGVIHVGASNGQERDIYAGLNLPVVWIEAIPDVFRRLVDNIAGYSNQRALHYLITERDGDEREFHVSSHDGHASSLFEFGEHAHIWPNIKRTSSFTATGITLKTALQRHAIDLNDYDAMVLDVQCAELLVLQGAGDLLDKFKFIRCEAADFELYKGGCQLADLDKFFTARGWGRTQTWEYTHRETGQRTHLYEALYEKLARKPQIAPIYIADTKTDAKAIYRVATMASVPRLGFQAHMGATERAFADPHIPILRESGCVFWEMTMQNGFNTLIKAGADYIITIDYDSLFTNEDVKELLRLIVRYPDADAIAAWQASRWKEHNALAGIKKLDGAWGAGVPIEDMKRLDLTKIENTVFGLTIIKVSALQKMSKPWFLNTPNKDGEWEAGKHDADSYFWWKFREAGNSLYMANRVRIGHLHEDVLWIDDDFHLIKQDLTDYHSKGRPF